MENEIKVGEYVRFRNGKIDKVIHKEKDTNKMWFENTYGRKTTISIVKHSSILIDLIQCEDYVNGEIIDQIENDRNPKLIWHLSAYGDEDIAFKNEDIETIVTKEMMESISYKVKQEEK